ncbi:hypothetical protein LTR33_001460 [Friedmanniomyces endolithicus]|nr:hypothetical protein LTR33_001460 [Friedmanniomyces endolithicus]
MLSLGQVLKGKAGSYKLASKLQDSVWLAIDQLGGQKVIVKHAKHFRVQNERDVLLRFQGQTSHLRPLLDEVEFGDGERWPALVLSYLDDDLLTSSSKRRLTRTELKSVGKGVLKALEVLHKDGFVHTDSSRGNGIELTSLDIKPSNVLVNYDPLDGHIADVQLADLESTVHKSTIYATDGDPIGTPIFRSTEAILQMQWGTATDVWSFGTMMVSLFYGGNFHIFKPDVSADHEDYDIKILSRHHQCFGPFPLSYEEIVDGDRLEIITWIMRNTPADSMRPFRNTTGREITEEDKRFVLKIMKLDPRTRPTVEELLADEWFLTV